ncbi:MAG: hypothetical protein ACRC1V_12090 [Plesiomonas sp.]
MQFLDSLHCLDSEPRHDADACHVFYRATFLSAVATRLITSSPAQKPFHRKYLYRQLLR